MINTPQNQNPAETRSRHAARTKQPNMNAPNTVPTLVTGAAVLLGLLLAISGGTLDPYALALVTVAGGAAFAAARFNLQGHRASATRLPVVILGFGIAISLIHDVLFLPGVLVNPARLGGFRPGMGAMALVLVTYFWKTAPTSIARIRFPAMVLIAAGLGAIVLYASPTPGIDVWHLQQEGALVLLKGENPYNTLYPNIYGPGTSLIDSSVLSPDGKYVITYPYMPLTLLLGAPAAWLGDVRWLMLAGLAFSAIIIRKLGRSSLEAELAGAFFLIQPQGFMVLELAWTEPLVLATILMAVWSVTHLQEEQTKEGSDKGWEWLAAGIAGTAAASSKQYAPLLLIPFLFVLPVRIRVKATAAAICGTLIILLPFLIWNPSAFFRGTLEFHLHQPFRPDALSWLAAIVALGGPPFPSWPAFLCAGVSLATTIRRKISLSQGVLASATVWIVFVAFNKQAFCNYYWLAGGLLCTAVSLVAQPPDKGK